MFSLDFIKESLLYILGAIPVTLGITLTSILLASLLGALYALVIIKRWRLGQHIVYALMSFGRSTPVLVMLYFIFYVYPYAKVGLLNEPINQMASNKLAPSVAAILTFTIVFSAYFAEVFRSALSAVDKGQLEAGLSVGLSSFTCFRRIILPQALHSGLPNYTNVVVDLIKDTSLVYSITVIDVMARANIAAARGFHFVEAYVIVLIIYIAICFVFAKSLRLFEIRLGNKWNSRHNGMLAS